MNNNINTIVKFVFQFQVDTEQLSETLTQLSSTLDPDSVSQMSNSKTFLQLEVREKQEDREGRNLQEKKRESLEELMFSNILLCKVYLHGNGHLG